MIPYGQHHLTDEDIAAVLKVLRSKNLTQGGEGPKFEKAVRTYCKVKYAFAVNSATSALHTALMALDVGPNDVVWTSPITFVATANAALFCGATVDFVDIDPNSNNMSLNILEEKLIAARKNNELPKVVIPVHLAGRPCEMEKFANLAKEFGFKIVEDASHAIGAEYLGEPVGSCKFSDITVFSLHPVKIITAGEGGLLTTNSDTLSKNIALFRSHGITRNVSEMTNKPHGPWYYQQLKLGYNFRMTDIQAALGNSQMSILDQNITIRNKIAAKYDQQLFDLPVKLPQMSKLGRSSFHLYIIRLNTTLLSKTHRQIFEELIDHGIGVNIHYIPVHMQPYYQDLGFKIGQFPNAEEYYQEAISLPIFPILTDEDQMFVVETLRKVLLT